MAESRAEGNPKKGRVRYTEDDRDIFNTIIMTAENGKFFPIIQSEVHTNTAKREAWEEITNLFNSQTGRELERKQVRGMYNKKKDAAKKKHDRHTLNRTIKKECLKTGGGRGPIIGNDIDGDALDSDGENSLFGDHFDPCSAPFNKMTRPGNKPINKVPDLNNIAIIDTDGNPLVDEMGNLLRESSVQADEVHNVLVNIVNNVMAGGSIDAEIKEKEVAVKFQGDNIGLNIASLQVHHQPASNKNKFGQTIKQAGKSNQMIPSSTPHMDHIQCDSFVERSKPVSKLGTKLPLHPHKTQSSSIHSLAPPSSTKSSNHQSSSIHSFVSPSSTKNSNPQTENRSSKPGIKVHLGTKLPPATGGSKTPRDQNKVVKKKHSTFNDGVNSYYADVFKIQKKVGGHRIHLLKSKVKNESYKEEILKLKLIKMGGNPDDIAVYDSSDSSSSSDSDSEDNDPFQYNL